MSQYLSKLIDRDGIDWPNEPGHWKQSHPTSLSALAGKLEVAQVPPGHSPHKPHSSPTPWAALVEFAGALFSPRHPWHREAVEQWHGLLGAIALANPLRLDLQVHPIKLSDHPHRSPIIKTFIDLRPRPLVANQDMEDGKWDIFWMIWADGQLIGATSPYTLVFPGVAHRCPPSIPFQTEQGRLSDPAAFYRRFNDRRYLQLLAYWISSFRNALEQNQMLEHWLGVLPGAAGATRVSRRSLLVEHLTHWLAALGDIPLLPMNGGMTSRFQGPFSILTGLPELPEGGQSDLYLRGTCDRIICYHAGQGSEMVDEYGQRLMDTPLQIYNGHWITANQPLPEDLRFLPDHIKVLQDPARLFEDVLIPIHLPDHAEAVYALPVDNGPEKPTFLYPYKPEILDYLSPSEIARHTRIYSMANSLVIELKIPMEGHRYIRTWRHYLLDHDVFLEIPTVELAVWPDFISPAWSRYFYFKSSVNNPQVDFEPVRADVAWGQGDHAWCVSSKPIEVFQGSVHGQRGLLLLRPHPVEPPTTFWKVGVDIGSTHTLAFMQPVEPSGPGFAPQPNADIQPIEFSTWAKPLTSCNGYALRDQFIAFTGAVEPSRISELKTLLIRPVLNEPIAPNTWLPRDGFIYTHWLYSGNYDANKLRYNLKWSRNAEDPDLRAFLRCLVTMIEAEAIRRGARVVSIEHTYPSVFTQALKAKHNAEWRHVEQFVNAHRPQGAPRLQISDASVSETVAVCRHLEWEQDASPVSNTISIDVGGSTSDLAVWTRNVLRRQESVKLAAGLIGQYLQSSDAQPFLQWLEATVKGVPFSLTSFTLRGLAGKPSGYTLMFNNLLSLLDSRRQLRTLVDQVRSAETTHRFLSHLIYLYAALLYYTGLLARKAELAAEQSTFYVHFCGKGGTMIEWIPGYEELVRHMFLAGLLGPGAQSPAAALNVVCRLSTMPKEEVGRGLLAGSALPDRPETRGMGLLYATPPSVTVGETGYAGLDWNGALTAEALANLSGHMVPAVQNLLELSTFIQAFRQGAVTACAGEVLGLNNVAAPAFENRLRHRLFGQVRGCVLFDLQNHADDALVEPLFITEAKVLLEEATRNPDLFS